MKVYFLLFSFLGYLQAFANIENIVFEGAGIRGIAYSGVIKVLEEEGRMKQIKKVGGTSAGAITALAISLGYNWKETDSIISNTNFKKFNDGKFFFIGGLHRLNKRYGYFQGKKFTTWIEHVIEQKTGNGNITFQELYNKGYKDIYITAVSLNQQKLIVFSKQTYPNMKVKDAIRASMSIPIYFEAVWIDEHGNMISEKERTAKSDLMIDGGMLANLPIHIFPKEEDLKTIGVRIDTDEQMELDKAGRRELATYQIDNVKNYANAFYNLLLDTINRSDLTEDDWKRTVSVSSKGISPRIKKLSKRQKQLLIDGGEEAMKEWLRNK